MNVFLKTLAQRNKDAKEIISNLEDYVKELANDKSCNKVEFANTCLALRGYRLVADATDALLVNEGIVIGNDGSYYEKVNIEDETPSTEKKSNE